VIDPDVHWWSTVALGVAELGVAELGVIELGVIEPVSRWRHPV
jgi:hypothetical protein